MQNPITKLFELSDTPLNFFSINWQELGVSSPYIIIFTGRSGSTLLTKLLNNADCGNPDEFFTEDFIKYAKQEVHSNKFQDYFKYIAGNKAKNGYFGFEIDAQRFFWLNQLVNLEQAISPKSHIPVIWLTRQDIISQAYSFAVAKTTGLWHIYEDGKTSSTEIHHKNTTIDDDMIWKELLLILKWEKKIEQLFNDRGFAPLRITYEQLVNDQALVLARIMSHIGLQEQEIDKKISTISSRDEPTKKLQYSDKIITLTSFYSKHSQLINKILSNRQAIEEINITLSLSEASNKYY